MTSRHATLTDEELIAGEIERQFLIDGLEGHLNPSEARGWFVKRRDALAALDRVLDCWKRWSRESRSAIALEDHAALDTQSAKMDVFEERITPEYGEEYMQWFDDLILSLNEEQKRLLHYEVFHPNDRRRALKWANEFGYHHRTYYNRLSSTRDMLMLAIVRKE